MFCLRQQINCRFRNVDLFSAALLFPSAAMPPRYRKILPKILSAKAEADVPFVRKIAISETAVTPQGYSKSAIYGCQEAASKRSSFKSPLGQFTRNYTQTVKRAADNKRRYAPGWVHSTCLLRGFPKGAAPHLAHDFAEQSVVCYTLCRRCPENTVAAGEGKGI